MKSVIALFLIAAVVSIRPAKAMSDDMKAAMMEKMQQCIAETKVSEAEIALIKKHEPVQTREGKCFKACVMSKCGMLTDDNMLNKDVLLEKAKAIGVLADKMGVVSNIADECSQVTDADKCEAANKICQCIFNHKDIEMFQQLL